MMITNAVPASGRQASAEVLDAAGPEQISAAFTTAIATTAGHAEELTGIAGVLGEAADRYETLQMIASTLGHLRDGATAVGAAAGVLATAAEQLHATLADFDTRDGHVGDAVAEAGNLMRPEGYTTSFTTTTEQPMTSLAIPATPVLGQTAATPDDAVERPDRERLACGFYIDGWGSRGRDRAREWDAGRVDPQLAADAYEVADAILAARTQIASGPGAARMEAMRDNGITRCPTWCAQADDEDQYEEHFGPVRTLTTEDSATAAVRPRVSWWEQTTPAAEITITPGLADERTVVLSTTDLTALQQLSNQVIDEDPDQHKPAYPGAAYDDADTTWNVSPSAVAAEALDLEERASGFYFSDTEDGPYLDWSYRNPATRERNLEVGDGTDTASISLTSEDLRGLRDGIGRLVGAVHDGQEDPGALYPDAEDDDVYIDWSSVADGVRIVEFGDGESTAVLEMPEPQLREWYARLALRVQLNEQDDAA